MKKESFTSIFMNGLQTIRNVCIVSLLLVIYNVQNVSAQGCPLACDNLVQVSLDENCLAVITPDMILEDPGDGCPYTVVVLGTNGLPLPNATVNQAHINKTLTVAVYLGSNSCWGTIYVEDKLPPVIICPEPDTVFCNQTVYPIDDPIVIDNCGNSTRHVLSDITVKYPCDSFFAGKRIISYYYTDVSGNRSDTCEQCIYFKKIVPEVDIVWPRDTIFDCLDMDTVPFPKITGVPLVDGEFIYPSWGICKVALTYEDQLIPICPKAFKVLRKWTYIDWCRPSGQNVITHYQIIKVVDERGPVIACAPDVTVNTDVWTCTGTVILPTPTIVAECSKTSVKVGYKIVSPNGTPTFEGTSTDNVTNLKNGLYSITKLPLGLNWVVFHVTDECGNSTDCATEVTVQDMVPPTAICDQKTVVTLTLDGTAKIAAITFDDGSLDNCGIDYFEAKRMDDGVPCKTVDGHLFKPYVYFCCDDIGKTLMVAMRVWDIHGNSNTCMVEVVVQDKLAPIIVCPPDITISCEFDYTDYNVFGTVRSNFADRKPIIIKDKYVSFGGPAIDGYAYDGCGFTIKETVIPDLRCGQGRIFRRFEATDPGGLTSICTQTITIQDFTNENVEVHWPLDYYSTTICISKLNLTPDITGKPFVTGADKCSNIIQTYDDLIFTLDPDACLKILRKWIVIDWCIYNPNDREPRGYWTWTQVIKIVNTVAPRFQNSCVDRTVDVFGPGCKGFIPLVGYAIDDCTDSTELVWSHIVDIDNNGKIDSAYSGPGRDASAVYPVGVHKVTFKVTDACRNESVCTFIMTVRDGKKPTPYCLGHIVTTVMPSTQNIEIWAKDFNLNSEDNCTPKDSLKYYFLINGRFVPSVVFNCSNIGKNILKIYVVDQAGNSDYCEATLEIQDPNQVCPTGITIEGKIVTLTNAAVKDVLVSWERQLPLGKNSSYTSQNGVFTFLNLTSGMTYSINAEKNTGFINGVSTYDIVLIQRHILGLQVFDSPFKYLAADVNSSCTVTAADISEIRRLILGKISSFAQSPSWKFVPQTSILPKDNACGFEHVINYNLISRNQMNADFYGIKMGDINIDVNAGNLQKSSSRSDKNINLYIQDQMLLEGAVQKIPVYLSESMSFEGLQIAYDFDPTQLKIESIESAQLDITNEEYSINSNNGILSISGASNKLIDNTRPIFNFVVRAKKDVKLSNQISLNQNLINAEWYDADLMIYPITFQTRNSNVKPGEVTSVLYQNKPNPFTESTVIGFEIPKAQQVEFIFYEMDGKVIHRTSNIYSKGYHEFEIKKATLNTFGVIFMQMNTEDFTDTKRLVLIH